MTYTFSTAGEKRDRSIFHLFFRSLLLLQKMDQPPLLPDVKLRWLVEVLRYILSVLFSLLHTFRQ